MYGFTSTILKLGTKQSLRNSSGEIGISENFRSFIMIIIVFFACLTLFWIGIKTIHHQLKNPRSERKFGDATIFIIAGLFAFMILIVSIFS